MGHFCRASVKSEKHSPLGLTQPPWCTAVLCGLERSVLSSSLLAWCPYAVYNLPDRTEQPRVIRFSAPSSGLQGFAKPGLAESHFFCSGSIPSRAPYSDEGPSPD